MSRRTLYTQKELDLELHEYEELLGSSFCELVKGEIPTSAQDMRDKALQEVVRKKLELLLKSPSKPQLILYQLPAGQQSLICFSLDDKKKLTIGYRDLDSRPPTKRVKESVNEIVNEFLKKE